MLGDLFQKSILCILLLSQDRLSADGHFLWLTLPLTGSEDFGKHPEAFDFHLYLTLHRVLMFPINTHFFETATV